MPPIDVIKEAIVPLEGGKRGWAGGKFVPANGENWPLSVAAKVLEIPEADLRDLVRVLGLQPVGVIRMSSYRRQGRQPRAYSAVKLCQAVDAIRDLRDSLS